MFHDQRVHIYRREEMGNPCSFSIRQWPNGVYLLLFWSIGDIGQTRPREALAHAPDCPKSSSDALVRCLQTLPSTRTFYLLLEHVVGASRTVARAGSYGSPLLTTRWGGMPPQIYQIPVVLQRDYTFTPLDRNRTPT